MNLELVIKLETFIKSPLDFKSAIPQFSYPASVAVAATLATVSPDLKSPNVQIVSSLASFLTRIPAANFAQHHRRIDANAFTLTKEQRPYAEGFFPFGAFFNHSCAPVAFPLYINRTQYIIAMRDIAVDEEITVPYIDVIHPPSHRAEKLRTAYGFTCRCSRCKGWIESTLGCIHRSLHPSRTLTLSLHHSTQHNGNHIQENYSRSLSTPF
ncbi:hypothetical protein BC829DRAFT_228014 [Chytridium lagenaria]|nr:hypothetical protein BC829DRAFT_228014 [Chytridium lagenaria]